MRQPVAQHDLARHADALELRALERGDVDAGGIGARVQRHVDERAGGVLDRLEALVEAPRRACSCSISAVGHRLAGRVVQRMPRSTSGSNAQCSKICEGSSTKSRSTCVPDRRS